MYRFSTVAADFVKDVVIDSIEVTCGGKASDVDATCLFAYNSADITTISVPVDKAGTWKVSVHAHFAGVGYTFALTIDAK